MATGGETVGNRGTCSVCFEDYKGRTPKLLPCFHTFCVTCLGLLVQRETKQFPMMIPDNSGDKRKICLTCPTCRTVIPVPPGGVSQFQTNFYIEDASEADDKAHPCSLCDGDRLRDARFHCSKCEKYFCQDCRRYHDKLCEGVKVKALQVPSGARPKDAKNLPSNQTKQQIHTRLQMVEKILMELREEEETVKMKRTSMEEDINIRYAAVMRHVSDAQAVSLESVKKACDGATQRLQACVTKARQAQDTLLQQLSSANTVSAPSHLTPLDIEDLQARVRERTKCTLRLSANLDPATLLSCLQSFFGEVEETSKNPFSWTKDSTCTQNPKDDTQGQKEAASPVQASAALIADSTDVPVSVKQQLKNLTDKLSMLQLETDKKISTVQSSLQQEIAGLRDRYATLQQDHAMLTSENEKLRRHQAGPQQAQGSSDATQRDLRAAQSHITSLQNSVSSLEDLFRAVSSRATDLESTMAEMRMRVAFHAELDRPVTTRSIRTLFMREVRTNIGGSYSPSTGVFTAPVPGIYCFFATIGPGMSEKESEADIMVDGVRTVCALARGESVSSCHAVFFLEEGQKVFLETTSGENRYDDNGVTSFSGMLLQSAL